MCKCSIQHSTFSTFFYSSRCLKLTHSFSEEICPSASESVLIESCGRYVTVVDSFILIQTFTKAFCSRSTVGVLDTIHLPFHLSFLFSAPAAIYFCAPACVYGCVSVCVSLRWSAELFFTGGYGVCFLSATQQFTPLSSVSRTLFLSLSCLVTLFLPLALSINMVLNMCSVSFIKHDVQF